MIQEIWRAAFCSSRVNEGDVPLDLAAETAAGGGGGGGSVLYELAARIAGELKIKMPPAALVFSGYKYLPSAGGASPDRTQSPGHNRQIVIERIRPSVVGSALQE